MNLKWIKTIMINNWIESIEFEIDNSIINQNIYDFELIIIELNQLNLKLKVRVDRRGQTTGGRWRSACGTFRCARRTRRWRTDSSTSTRNTAKSSPSKSPAPDQNASPSSGNIQHQKYRSKILQIHQISRKIPQKSLKNPSKILQISHVFDLHDKKSMKYPKLSQKMIEIPEISQIIP